MQNLEDSGNWLSFYFTYGTDRTIEDFYQAIKNVLDQLEIGFKKISQSEAQFMHIVFILSFTELILLNLFIVKFSKKAEITARFSEDTLNQQILSIDNEFKNGKLTKKEAENQKIEVLKEAQRLATTGKILKSLEFLGLTVSLCAGLLTVPLFLF